MKTIFYRKTGSEEIHGPVDPRSLLGPALANAQIEVAEVRDDGTPGVWKPVGVGSRSVEIGNTIFNVSTGDKARRTLEAINNRTRDLLMEQDQKRKDAERDNYRAELLEIRKVIDWKTEVKLSSQPHPFDEQTRIQIRAHINRLREIFLSLMPRAIGNRIPFPDLRLDDPSLLCSLDQHVTVIREWVMGQIEQSPNESEHRQGELEPEAAKAALLSTAAPDSRLVRGVWAFVAWWFWNPRIWKNSEWTKIAQETASQASKEGLNPQQIAHLQRAVDLVVRFEGDTEEDKMSALGWLAMRWCFTLFFGILLGIGAWKKYSGEYDRERAKYMPPVSRQDHWFRKE